MRKAIPYYKQEIALTPMIYYTYITSFIRRVNAPKFDDVAARNCTISELSFIITKLFIYTEKYDIPIWRFQFNFILFIVMMGFRRARRSLHSE
jgi:hypothetical protein